MWKRRKRGNRNAPRHWFSKAKAVRRESEERRVELSITLLGNVASIKEERESYRNENSWS